MLVAVTFAVVLAGKAPGAHWVDYKIPGQPLTARRGVAMGTPRKDERLIIFMIDGKCSSAKRFDGRYGDWWAARRFLRHQMGCRLPWAMPVSKAG